ncbi:MAG: UDP-N-acetylglucosamine 2-epimerase (non-hydrolyzing) [Holosporaceae bacterium]|nr:MAG: UDP-N-acetylglucosamine 2-epimerase (non-hydrolyzing) [Holosporaceae bacterium]
MSYKVLSIFGTRPEALKIIPILKEFERQSHITSIVCSTGQHQEMLQQVVDLFDVSLDYSLNVMMPNQSLSQLTTRLLFEVNRVIEEVKPDLVLVQGDTTTTFVGSLAAYYNQIAVAHVEAGLRTHDIYSPWPEEVNRKMTGVVSALHFAPSQDAELNLLKEGVSRKNIFLTGNTIIDTLVMALKKIKTPTHLTQLEAEFQFLDPRKKMILVTGHRRESFGQDFKNICLALRRLAQLEDVQIVFPAHLNPNVQGPVNSILAGQDNIFLLPPLGYLSFIYLMKVAHFIITDSGGVQEEASYLRRPILVTRRLTEREEALSCPEEAVVGAKVGSILAKSQKLLHDVAYYKEMSATQNPYGNGHAAEKIATEITQYFKVPYFQIYNIVRKNTL